MTTWIRLSVAIWSACVIMKSAYVVNRSTCVLIRFRILSMLISARSSDDDLDEVIGCHHTRATQMSTCSDEVCICINQVEGALHAALHHVRSSNDILYCNLSKNKLCTCVIYDSILGDIRLYTW